LDRVYSLARNGSALGGDVEFRDLIPSILRCINIDPSQSKDDIYFTGGFIAMFETADVPESRSGTVPAKTKFQLKRRALVLHVIDHFSTT
jgi:hypothetical protein